MRILYLAETPIIEIQEAIDGEDMLIDLGNVKFNYSGQELYQYQEGPTAKEVKEMQETINQSTTQEEKEEKTQDMIKLIRAKSKKVLYKVITPNGLLVDFIKSLTDGKPVTKEYLD